MNAQDTEAAQGTRDTEVAEGTRDTEVAKATAPTRRTRIGRARAGSYAVERRRESGARRACTRCALPAPSAAV
ncbi:hypothetical protein [Streptomyces sp. NPDC057910]|uniref:hypothetical protein n=1 Tax=Streptomyces sp. NPDC057910 TaxID=3346278 RepID=UPI0036E7DE17